MADQHIKCDLSAEYTSVIPFIIGILVLLLLLFADKSTYRRTEKKSTEMCNMNNGAKMDNMIEMLFENEHGVNNMSVVCCCFFI